MFIGIVTSREWDALLAYLQQMENRLNALQTVISTLQADVSALSSAVTALQANQFTAADVANVQALDTQVKALTAALTPPAPAPSS